MTVLEPRAWLRSASNGTKSSLGGGSQGQHDIEGATLPLGTLGPDAPPMCLHQLPGEIQSNAEATNGGPIERGSTTIFHRITQQISDDLFDPQLVKPSHQAIDRFQLFEREVQPVHARGLGLCDDHL